MNKAHKILIADDEPVGRQLLEAILYTEGYDLLFANDGVQALNSIKENIPDLVLLDVMMPKMDGFEVCKKVRSNPETAHIPIFLITALDDRDSKIKGIDSGADDYISKPFDRIEILGKIKNRTALMRYRDKHEFAEKQRSESTDDVLCEEKLIHYLSELLSEIIFQTKNNNCEVFSTLEITKSRHSFYINENDNGTFYCLFSNSIEQRNKTLAKCIISMLLKKYSNNQKITPVGLLNETLDQLSKVTEDYKIPGLRSNLDSIIIVFIEKKSRYVLAAGMNQIIYYLDQKQSQNNPESLTYHSIILSNKKDFEIQECDRAFLISDIYDLMDPQEIISFLNQHFISVLSHNFFDIVSEKLNQDGDHIMVKLSI